MAGRLFSPFPLSSHTPPRVYHYCSPRVYFSLLRYLPRVSRPMRERTADGIAPSRPLSVSRPPPFARTGFLLLFDRIWISRYKPFPCPVSALPLFLYMPTRDHSGKTNSIFSGKNSAYSRTSGFLDMFRCCLAARKGQYYPCIAFRYLLLFYIKLGIRASRSRFSEGLQNFAYGISRRIL